MGIAWTLTVSALAAAVFAGAAAAKDDADAPPADRLDLLPQTQWPPNYEPLDVTVTPPDRRKQPEPEARAPAAVPDWAAVPLPHGSVASLAPLLERSLQHEHLWSPDAAMTEADAALRPPLPEPTYEEALVAATDMGLVLGGRLFALSREQIFAYYGLMPDGSRPVDTGNGVFSFIDPVTCLDGSIDCRMPLTGTAGPIGP